VGAGDPVPTRPPAAEAELEGVLRDAQRFGFLGPGSVPAHIEHARGFADALAAVTGGSPPDGAHVLDLGSGGGVPGLVLAMRWPGTTLVLLESSSLRAAFLARSVARLGVGGRVSVCQARSEDVGRRPAERGAYAVVVARSFGRPAVTAEAAAPLLTVGGHLVVSEPPAGHAAPRWPPAGLAELGLGAATPVQVARRYVVLEQRQPCPERYPRRVGVPARRPLF